IQVNPPTANSGQLSSVLVEGANDRFATHLNLARCFFGARERASGPAWGGQDAVTLDGAATVFAEQCTFGPHVALFHCRQPGSQSPPSVTLKECSALLVNGAAFQAEEKAPYKLYVQHCLFSRPESPGAFAPAVLIKQNGADGAVTFYKGSGNR